MDTPLLEAAGMDEMLDDGIFKREDACAEKVTDIIFRTIFFNKNCITILW